MTRVLVVDDHAAVRRAVGQVVADGVGGAVVGEAATGEDAARLVACEAWDLVLLDLALGDGAGGFQTLRELRRLRPGLPVVVMSMYPEAQYGAAARAAGATGYVAKGSAPSTIVAVARAAIGNADRLGSGELGAPEPVAGGAGPSEGPVLVNVMRSLHDEVAQALAAAKISLGLAAAAAASEEIHRHAADADARVGEAIDSLRRVVARLEGTVSGGDTTRRSELPLASRRER